MAACWREEPHKRPSFRDIVDLSTEILKGMGGARPVPAGSRGLVREHLFVFVVYWQSRARTSFFVVGHLCLCASFPSWPGVCPMLAKK